MGAKLALWVFFSVILSFVPIIANVIIGYFLPRSAPVKDVLESGELILIAGTLCGAASGELLASGRTGDTLAMIAVGSCIVLLAICMLVYSGIKFIKNANMNIIINLKIVAGTTILFLFLGILSSTSCIVLSTYGEKPTGEIKADKNQKVAEVKS